jgi:hypothetical protein
MTSSSIQHKVENGRMTQTTVENRELPDILQPLALSSFRNWLTLLLHNGGIDPTYLKRALFVSAASLLTVPLRLYERALYGRVIETLPIEQPPIFIVGHWRSGTTHLQYMMSQDSNLGYVSTFQTIAPDFFLVGSRALIGKIVRPVLDRLMPAKRMMDNMAFALDGPQEEEPALASMSPYSFYHLWSFPRRAVEYFEQYALFRRVPEAIVARWKEIYLTILRKATLNMGGRRLLIKNPTNTGRIQVLLDLFPDAKFIHIIRNPYRVFLSTRHFYRKVLAIAQLQNIDQEEIDTNILLFYKEIMCKFLVERVLIPARNLLEIRFEDLEVTPLAQLQQIYERLNLPGFVAAKEAFRTYLASQVGYRKNSYDLNWDAIERVNQHWRFALEEWDYAVL